MTKPISSPKLSPRKLEPSTSLGKSSVLRTNPPNAPPAVHLSPILDGSNDAREIPFLPFFLVDNVKPSPAPVLTPSISSVTSKPNQNHIVTASIVSISTTTASTSTTRTTTSPPTTTTLTSATTLTTTTSATTLTTPIPEEEVTVLFPDHPSFEDAESVRVPEKVPSHNTKPQRLVITLKETVILYR